jgi:hypothetical protein
MIATAGMITGIVIGIVFGIKFLAEPEDRFAAINAKRQRHPNDATAFEDRWLNDPDWWKSG